MRFPLERADNSGMVKVMVAPGWYSGVAATSSHVYLVDEVMMELRAFAIERLGRLELEGVVQTLAPLDHIVFNEDVLYLSGRGMAAVDISRPSAPLLMWSMSSATPVYDLLVRSGAVFTATPSGILRGELRDREGPPNMGKWLDSTDTIVRLGQSGEYVYGGTLSGSVVVITDLNGVARVTASSTGWALVSGFAESEGGILALDGYTGALDALSVAPLMRTRLADFPAVTAHGAVANGRDVWVAAERGGVVRVDRGMTAIKARIPTVGPAYAVTIDGDRLAVAEGAAGTEMLTLNGEAWHRTGLINAHGLAVDVVLSGQHLYVAEFDAGVRILDVSDWASPIDVGRIAADAYVYALALDGEDLFVAAGSRGALSYSLQDPAAPTLLQGLPSSMALGVAGDQAYVYVADGMEGLVVYGRGDGRRVATIEVSGMARDVALSDSEVIVSASYGGLSAFRRANLDPVATFSSGSAWSATIDDSNIVWLSDGLEGIYALFVDHAERCPSLFLPVVSRPRGNG